MAGIDDWYLDHANRHELTPGYSADDDVPDPFVLGEVPGREWVIPRQRAIGPPRRTSSSSPKRKQSQAKSKTQLTPKPAASARRQPATRLGRTRRVAGWEQFALRWLRANPGGSNRELKAAVEEAGFLPLAKAEISALRAQMTSARKAARPTVKRRVRRTAPAPSATDYAPPVRYCDGCGLAVTNDGRCRC